MNNVFSKVFLAVCFVFVSAMAYGQCDYEVHFVDFQGDGTDGAKFQISVNGSDPSTIYTVSPVNSSSDLLPGIGDGALNSATISALPGSEIQIIYTPASNEDASNSVASNHGIVILDEVGRAVLAQNVAIDPVTGEYSNGGSFAQSISLVGTECLPVTCEQTFEAEENVFEGTCADSAEISLVVPVQAICATDFEENDSTLIKVELFDVVADTLIAQDSALYVVGTGNDENMAFAFPKLALGEYGYVVSYDYGPDSTGVYEQSSDTLQLFAVSSEDSKLVANDELNASFDANAGCQITFELDDLLESAPSCDNAPYYSSSFDIRFVDAYDRPIYADAARQYEISNTVHGNMYDVNGNVIASDRFKFIVTNRGTESSTWGYVNLEDKQGPSLAIADGEIACNHPEMADVMAGYGLNGIVGNDTLDVCNVAGVNIVPTPTTADAAGCSPIDAIEFVSAVKIDAGCTDGKYIERTYKAYANGKSTIATQKIVLRSPSLTELEDQLSENDRVLPCTTNDINTLHGTSDVKLSYECVDITQKEDEEDGEDQCGVSYTFEDSPISKGCNAKSGQFIRTWTIIAWCPSEAMTTVQQTIKVTDDVAPAVELTDVNIVSNSNRDNCSSDVTLTINVTDNCSDWSAYVEYEANGIGYSSSTSGLRSVQFDGNTALLENVPVSLDSVELNIFVTDECGNQSEISRKILAVDNAAPICNVDDALHVTVDGSGRGEILASNFDEGSYDNCRVDEILISQDNVNFYESLTYSCEFGDTVYLKVTDIYGNETTCWAEILVEDGIPPVITGQNHTATCGDVRLLSANLVAFPYPTVDDNCAPATPTFVSSRIISEDDCGSQVIERYFTADDASDKTGAVDFRDTITVSPDNLNFEICVPKDETINCDQLPNIPGGELTIENPSCKTIHMDTDTTIFKNANGGGCSEMHITYKIYDWCTMKAKGISKLNIDYTHAEIEDAQKIEGREGCYYGDTTDGYSEFTRVITIVDNEDPTFVSTPEDNQKIAANPSNCLGDVTFTVAGQDNCGDIAYSWALSGNGVNDSGNTATLSADGLAEGTYSVVWVISDNCDNTDTYTHTFEVADMKKPTPIALSLSSTVMNMENGFVDIWASDFIKEVTDNCTKRSPDAWKDNAYFKGVDNIINDGKGLRFGCDALGAQSVDVYVSDDSGNENFVTVTFTVTDNNNTCSTTSGSIAGSIVTETGVSVDKVNVTIDGGINASITNGLDGAFEFSNLEMGEAYVVKASKNGDLTEGVNAGDLVALVKHILSADGTLNAYQEIAADVDNNGRLSAADLQVIRNIVLENITELPNNSSWRFIDKSYSFSNNPLSDKLPAGVEIKSLTEDRVADFVAIKVGDVNSTVYAAKSRTGARLNVVADNANLVAGNTYEVAIKAGDVNTLDAYQLTMNLGSEVSFEGVEAGALNVSNENFGFNYLDKGYVTSVWNSNEAVKLNANDVLFTVSLTANKSAKLSEVFGISSNVTEAATFVYNNGVVESSELAISFANDVVATTLHQNTPNPFSNVTNITFDMAQAGQATITVFDVAGKVVKTIQGDFVQGFNQVEVSKSDLDATGVLYYQLNTADFTATKRMVVLK